MRAADSYFSSRMWFGRLSHCERYSTHGNREHSVEKPRLHCGRRRGGPNAAVIIAETQGKRKKKSGQRAAGLRWLPSVSYELRDVDSRPVCLQDTKREAALAAGSVVSRSSMTGVPLRVQSSCG